MSDYLAPEPPRSFLDKLRAGDYEAWHRFHKKYEGWLKKWTRKHWRLPHRRSSYSDIAQEVYKSLLRRLREGLRIEHLTPFLRGMAVRKLFGKAGQVFAAKRNPRREIGDASAVNRLEQPSATPSQVLIAREEYERFMHTLSVEERQTIELDLQGFSTKEIAKNMHCCQRTVQLRLERVFYRAAQS
jgi:DNA-directed RNA polymerase specialized sigma24 family protein